MASRRSGTRRQRIDTRRHCEGMRCRGTGWNSTAWAMDSKALQRNGKEKQRCAADMLRGAREEKSKGKLGSGRAGRSRGQMSRAKATDSGELHGRANGWNAGRSYRSFADGRAQDDRLCMGQRLALGLTAWEVGKSGRKQFLCFTPDTCCCGGCKLLYPEDDDSAG